MNSLLFRVRASQKIVSLFFGLVILGVAFASNGCQSENEEPDGSGTGLGGDSPDEVMICDGLTEQHDALLNAPTDAVVVRKTPNTPQVP